MHKLYHYVHCPFCLRVRFALGALGVNWESHVLPYDDEKTPVDLAGKKMLPIMSFPDGETINESLDIIKKLDPKNHLQMNLLDEAPGQQLEKLMDQITPSLFKLCMPYFIYTPEFDSTSREYFQKKKELKRGPFYQLIQQKETYLNDLQQGLDRTEKELMPFFQSKNMTILDIVLASHLWGLYIFPEFQFSQTLHQYLQEVKRICHFEYHEDFWKSERPIYQR